ncbi:MAG: transglutaminase-like domain-containing protein [Deltaproteobacteria bacterium]|nr:transglutaminase-like domain-containing protein [Deltaproteobacteria bacterium]
MAESPADPLTDTELERRAFDVGGENFSLWRAACLMPRVDGRPPRDVDPEIDRLAALVQERVRISGPVVALHDVVFATAGFLGDSDEYDHPRNSFIDDVVRRRRGLPITLSLVLTEIAARAGIKAWGLALPGHFLAAVFVDEARFTVVDAFRGGHLSSLEEVAKRVGVPASEIGELLQPAPPANVLLRMLTNLRGSYVRRAEYEPLCRVLSRMMLLRRRDPLLLLERAEVRRLLLDDEGARDDVAEARGASNGDDDIVRAADHMEELLDSAQIVN